MEEEGGEKGTIREGREGLEGREGGRNSPTPMGPDLHSLRLQACSQPGFCCLPAYSITSSLSCPERFFSVHLCFIWPCRIHGPDPTSLPRQPLAPPSQVLPLPCTEF